MYESFLNLRNGMNKLAVGIQIKSQHTPDPSGWSSSPNEV